MTSERGSATLVVLTLLALLTITIVINGQVLAGLRLELGQIDRQQQKRFVTPTP